jgi:hypothetical protein
MKLSTLFWVLGTWLFLNAIIPLIINSLERLYQPSIDAAVRSSLSYARTVFLALVQLLLIVLYAPTIVILGVIERLCPRLLETELVKQSDIYHSTSLVLKRAFWPTIAEELREWRQFKQSNNRRPNKASDATSEPAPGAASEVASRRTLSENKNEQNR